MWGEGRWLNNSTLPKNSENLKMTIRPVMTNVLRTATKNLQKKKLEKLEIPLRTETISTTAPLIPARIRKRLATT